MSNFRHLNLVPWVRDSLMTDLIHCISVSTFIGKLQILFTISFWGWREAAIHFQYAI